MTPWATSNPSAPTTETRAYSDAEASWARLKAWFTREPGRHDSYVSNVTNPDDRRFIPRR